MELWIQIIIATILGIGIVILAIYGHAFTCKECNKNFISAWNHGGKQKFGS